MRTAALLLPLGLTLRPPLPIAPHLGPVRPAPIACAAGRAEEPELPSHEEDGVPSVCEEVVGDPRRIREQERAFALIYNYRTGNEGVYARHLAESQRECVLLFVEREAAERYSEMLEANDFPEATAVLVDTAEILTFCEASGHLCGLVPKGALLVPPAENVPEFEWTPGLSEEGREALAGGGGGGDGELSQRRRALEAVFAAESGGDAGGGYEG